MARTWKSHPIENACPPTWASAWGQDRHGIWVEFEVAQATQRMRWILPGRFRMGSPETEVGRIDDEGPRHEVVINHGYWLFDTPCTQELWLAVLGGKNPSYFQDPRRPVEQVSCEDVDRFLKALNARLGIGLSLPTEAQWEYACRAGTTTATYAGDLRIVGENNAPVLDEIAWYGGNSGHEYDLDKSYDSSGWPEKQYPHTGTGTRRVGLKKPNAWGLYDMLGNVWEWCADYHAPYTAKSVVDPVGPDSGARRVIRGGSWYYGARGVRAASRLAYHAGNRLSVLGFRCLSSGMSAEPGSEAERSGAKEASGASARKVSIVVREPVSTPLPTPSGFEILTSFERLQFDRISKPDWAEDIGRDRYGLWTTFRVGKASQKMRWIMPGRFQMGSPETEEGRFENEGPRHEVVLSRGYWLFDTPCTQELWLEVLGGKNPSYFPDPRRPVEQVSYEDVSQFLKALTAEKGLVFSLPTEAQWEYACRAGTTGATYAGDLRIEGENNAAVLDAIAWYGGNSGHEYDLDKFIDLSAWAEKQYPHTRAGTRRVGLKKPNAWGLYDMLGNVWEWCADSYARYTADSVVDPVSTESGAGRVMRGGGWFGVARYVRAAYRSAYHAGNRDFDLGFRCLSSGMSAEPGVKAERSEAKEASGASARKSKKTRKNRERT